MNSEMDALPGIGHACGHNLIAIAGVAVACAIKAIMEKFDISGKIVLLGTPGKTSFVHLSPVCSDLLAHYSRGRWIWEEPYA